MKNNRVVCIVQARCSSKRLPQKILFKVKGQTLIEHQIDRLKKLKLKKKLIIATSKNKKDKIICKIAKKKMLDFIEEASKMCLNVFINVQE